MFYWNTSVSSFFFKLFYLFIYFLLAGADEDRHEISGHLDHQRDQNILEI